VVSAEYVTDATHANTVDSTTTTCCATYTYRNDDGTTFSVTYGGGNRTYDTKSQTEVCVYQDVKKNKIKEKTPQMPERDLVARKLIPRMPKIFSPPGGWSFFKG